MVIGQQLLIGAVFVAHRERLRHHWLGALLLLSAAAYVTQTLEPLSEGLHALRPLLTGLAIAVPYVLWQFGQVVFNTRRLPLPVVAIIFAIPIGAWLIFWKNDATHTSLWQAAFLVNHLVGLAVVLFTLVSVMLGHSDDLLEPRRRYRVLFVVLIGIQVCGILIAELLLDFDSPSNTLQVVNIVFIAALTLGLALPVLRIDGAAFSLPDVELAQDKELDGSELDPADRQLAERLLALMDGGHFRTANLSIGKLAKELKVPEYHLRRLINKHLDFQNFSSFLNHYRIRDAKVMLVDPDQAPKKVLSIAMNLGYGSVGPFNRAFKQATGLTPSEYRQRYLVNS